MVERVPRGFLFAVVILAIVLLSRLRPVGAEVMDIAVDNSGGSVLFDVFSNEFSSDQIGCQLRVHSSAGQYVEDPYEFTLSKADPGYTVTVYNWTEGVAVLDCGGQSLEGFILNVQDFTVDVNLVDGGSQEEPSETQKIEAERKTVDGQDFFSFTVFVTGENYLPECVMMAEYDGRAVPVGTVVPTTSIILPRRGEPALVTLQCDGRVTRSINFDGNSLPYDGEVILKRVTNSGGNNGGSRGNGGSAGGGKPIPDTYSPFVDYQNLRCLFGSVNIFWNVDLQNPEKTGIAVYGPKDIGGDPQVEYVGGAFRQTIIDANGGLVSASKRGPNSEAAFTGEPIIMFLEGETIKIEIRDTRDSTGKADVCVLNKDTGEYVTQYSYIK